MTSKHLDYLIADHVRAGALIIADGVLPSGKMRGYVLRKLMRRSFQALNELNIDLSNKETFIALVDSVITIYESINPDLVLAKHLIVETFHSEAQKFLKAIEVGTSEWNKYFKKLENSNSEINITSLTNKAWDLYQSNGVPVEVSEQITEKKGYLISSEELHALIEGHQQKSSDSSKNTFKSGLGEQNNKTIRLHTTTHILHTVLRELFGTTTRQIGSSITSDKARFDATIDQEITQENCDFITKTMQNWIDKSMTVTRKEMKKEVATQLGAIGLFGEKYPDMVSVYTISEHESVFSREFCSGPHVINTNEIGTFALLKVKSIGAGRKRFEFNVE
jgi:alanyl-tRNA synthetase